MSYWSGALAFGNSDVFSPLFSGGWKELGRTTLGSAGDDITVSSLPDKRYYMVLCFQLKGGGNTSARYRMGNSTIDTGATSYNYRLNIDGASSGTGGSGSDGINDGFAEQTDMFSLTYISNLSSNEKLTITK